MNERVMPKAKLDNLVLMCRGFYEDVNNDTLDKMFEATRDLEKEVGLGTSSLQDVITGIIRYSGLKHDATNEDIYKVLEVLGWTVE